jgi:hypothetical protein
MRRIMMAKRKYLALKMNLGMVKVMGIGIVKIDLPEGCDGVMFVFRTKKAARAYLGKDIELVELVEVPK